LHQDQSCICNGLSPGSVNRIYRRLLPELHLRMSCRLSAVAVNLTGGYPIGGLDRRTVTPAGHPARRLSPVYCNTYSKFSGNCADGLEGLLWQRRARRVVGPQPLCAESVTRCTRRFGVPTATT